MHSRRMQPTATDRVAWSTCLCVCRSVSVCLLITTVSPAQTDEPIEMQFGVWTHRNHISDGGRFSLQEETLDGDMLGHALICSTVEILSD